jgi:hypothetical protein
MDQIHQQKRDIVKDVDAGECIAEFNTIKQRRTAFEETDITKMEVPVGTPDPSFFPAGIKESSDL